MSRPSGSIAGRVLDATGAPVSGATVAVTGGLQPFRDIAAVTSGDGSFRLGAIQPGQYQLGIHARGKAGTAAVVVMAGAQSDVEIQLDG